jgi:hypothetical protein
MSPNHPIVSLPVPASESKIQPGGFAARVSEWNARQPVLAIVFVALVAVVINCYPIIFCGRSYVSPPAGTPMVYGWYPTLPGMKNSIPSGQTHGSDAWATELWGVPVGFIESRSLLDYGEFPLWNRYGHAGDTLVGQGISMLGDPLQLIVIIGRGSAGAWDIKFLAAKFLFCVGFGLLILRLLGSRPLSLIYAALAAYCGAFFFINIHPVFFVFSYAPWILLSALAWLDLQSEHYVRWGSVWLLANFACFNAGHLEVAVDLIGGLNLAAVACALTRGHKVADWTKVLGRMAVGTLFFLGLTAPIWMSFLEALKGSYSLHPEGGVIQLPAMSLPGAFDDLFFLLAKDDTAAALAPGTSLLVLAGCILSVLRWQQLKGEYFFWINGSAILLWSGCVFGWVPASVLSSIPFLNRVSHIYTDLSYLLVIHLTIQSALGFKCLALDKNFRRAAADCFWMVLIFGGMMLAFSLGINHHPIPWNYFACAAAGAVGAPLLFVFLKSRYRRISAMGWALVIILGFIPQFRFGLYHAGNDALLLIPGSRVVLNAPSQAVDWIKTDKAGPFRVVGVDYNLFSDYAAVYGIENICSCAPLSNREYIDLIRNFPGMEFSEGWTIRVADPVKAQSLLNMLNVKYLLTPPDVRLQEGLAFRTTERSDFAVMENLGVWPRAFFANQVVSIASNEEFIKHLLGNGRQPFVALTQTEIEKEPGLQRLDTVSPAAISPATNYRLSPNTTEFDIHASSAGVVCLTEGQAKDFTARANNEPKEVLTVNRAFKGIYLDQPGDYHVQFTYRPRHWRLACALFWISAGGVIMLALMSIICVNGVEKSRRSPSIEDHEPDQSSSN